MAAVLPGTEYRIPFTTKKFSLNPGPWNVKEHVLVTITAASGATSSIAANPIVLADLYYGEKIHPFYAMLFMFSIVMLGYSLAGISRNFVIYDPSLPWQRAVMHTQLFEAFRVKSDGNWLAKRKKKIFFGCLVGMCLWQFLPEFLFPMLGSLAVMCWLSPRNPTFNFIGSGLGGLGVLNWSFNWSNIASHWSNPMIVPFWTTVLICLGYVIQCWIIIPLLKWTSLSAFKEGLMSNRIMTRMGERYPYKEIMNADYSLNEKAYQEIGPVHIGAHYASTIFFDYAAFISAFVWIALFNFDLIRKGVNNSLRLKRQQSGRGMSWILNDRLNVLMRQYKEVPAMWFAILFGTSFVAILLLTQDLFHMPAWAFIIAILMGTVAIIPMSWLYSISSFQVATGPFNTLTYGLMINRWYSGKRHPVGASAYTAIAGSTWYRAQYMLQDMKIGHLMHIAPRAVFFSQIFGEVVGIPVNYAVIH